MSKNDMSLLDTYVSYLELPQKLYFSNVASAQKSLFPDLERLNFIRNYFGINIIEYWFEYMTGPKVQKTVSQTAFLKFLDRGFTKVRILIDWREV